MAILFRYSLKVIILAFVITASGMHIFGQGDQPKPIAPKTTPTPALQKIDLKNLTADQVVEFTILYYGLPSGREKLNQIRKTTFERGRMTFTAADGSTTSSNYQRFIIRADTLDKEKVRLDQEFPSARYAMVRAEDKIYGLVNNTVFTPREDAVRTFENQLVHGLEALLRYRENGSTITLAPKEKVYGVDYYVVDVTDKQARKTRFYISAKSFRVMMLTYEDSGIKYRRKFYDYKYAQGTLVAFRTVLWADDKQVEESEIGTITFGQKVDEELFKAG
jgi:hypothetical protein